MDLASSGTSLFRPAWVVAFFLVVVCACLTGHGTSADPGYITPGKCLSRIVIIELNNAFLDFALSASKIFKLCVCFITHLFVVIFLDFKSFLKLQSQLRYCHYMHAFLRIRCVHICFYYFIFFNDLFLYCCNFNLFSISFTN